MEFNFNENLAVDNLDKVPQDFHGLYKKNDETGKFQLNSEDASVKSAVSAITKLNSALAAERKNKKPNIDLTPLKEFGETPEDIKAALDKKIEEARIGGDKDAKMNLEKIKEEFSKTHAKDLTERDAKIKGLTDQIYDLTVVSAATSAISENKGVVELLMPFVRNAIKVIEVEGKMIPRVVDAAGDIRFSGITGEPMTIAELVKEMKSNEKYMRLFESDTPSGSGAKPAAAAKPNQTTMQKDKSSVDKISAGLSALKRK